MMKDGYVELIGHSGNVRVEIEWIGEGIQGDYDEDDSEDIPLLRFSVYKREEGDYWEEVDDASYCTQLPATIHPNIARRAARYIMDWVEAPLKEGYSIKKICERLSWLDVETLTPGSKKKLPGPFMTV